MFRRMNEHIMYCGLPLTLLLLQLGVIKDEPGLKVLCSSFAAMWISGVVTIVGGIVLIWWIV